jgi:hypothetical protein
MFNHPEISFHEICQTRRFEGFPEFPNTSPSGKRVDSDDPIPRKLWNSVKNVTLETSEWTRVLRKFLNGRIEVSSWNYPPRPYK